MEPPGKTLLGGEGVLVEELRHRWEVGKAEAPQVSEGQVEGCVGGGFHGRIHGCCFQSSHTTREEVEGMLLLKAGEPIRGAREAVSQG